MEAVPNSTLDVLRCGCPHMLPFRQLNFQMRANIGSLFIRATYNEEGSKGTNKHDPPLNNISIQEGLSCSVCLSDYSTPTIVFRIELQPHHWKFVHLVTNYFSKALSLCISCHTNINLEYDLTM